MMIDLYWRLPPSIARALVTSARIRKTKLPPQPREAAPPSPVEATTEREARGARRKRETREKLIQAAFRLMSERGMDAVAINHITEAADVGLGSFYNHFESKEAIYAAVNDLVFEGFADALDGAVKDLEDPAEVIAISIRHTLLRARREPRWGRLLVREGLSARSLSRGLGARLLRDMEKGIAKRRFKLFDPMVAFMLTGAGLLGAVAAEIDPGSDGDVQKRGFRIEDLPERTAAVVLHQLGVPEAEARKISRRPLPAIDRPPLSA